MSRSARCPDFAHLLRESGPNDVIGDMLVNCFSNALERQARQRCHNSTLAQDAAQDALLTALEKLGTFRGDAPIEAWLRRLVNSACSRLTRGRKNAPAFNRPLEDLPQSAEANLELEATIQERALLLDERLALLREAMDELSAQNRQLLLAHEAGDEPIAVLAERFGVSADAVKSRLKRARAQLRARLLELAEHEVDP